MNNCSGCAVVNEKPIDDPGPLSVWKYTITCKHYSALREHALYSTSEFNHQVGNLNRVPASLSPEHIKLSQ